MRLMRMRSKIILEREREREREREIDGVQNLSQGWQNFLFYNVISKLFNKDTFMKGFIK